MLEGRTHDRILYHVDQFVESRQLVQHDVQRINAILHQWNLDGVLQKCGFSGSGRFHANEQALAEAMDEATDEAEGATGSLRSVGVGELRLLPQPPPYPPPGPQSQSQQQEQQQQRRRRRSRSRSPRQQQQQQQQEQQQPRQRRRSRSRSPRQQQQQQQQEQQQPRQRRRSRTRSPRQEQQQEQQVSGWCINCKCLRERCFQRGDWKCKQCGNHNYSGHVACTNNRCRESAPPAPPQPVHSGSSSSREGECQPYIPKGWCRGCSCWREDCFRKYDWACPTCGNHNYARKQAIRESTLSQLPVSARGRSKAGS